MVWGIRGGRAFAKSRGEIPLLSPLPGVRISSSKSAACYIETNKRTEFGEEMPNSHSKDVVEIRALDVGSVLLLLLLCPR